ncbi:hypothetical protein W911_06845 [Hyphomicrobium nitrativorans NL23]|uniref:Uncharacterized protein n=1 Tax=Hyphomicrobium nitrativorans NL23 TaxID=1029756 RepID=V5SHT5_9HYPH|nr:hypothetical protein W911_06845 [Hyphomicrobium nitrativorans NL23]
MSVFAEPDIGKRLFDPDMIANDQVAALVN